MKCSLGPKMPRAPGEAKRILSDSGHQAVLESDAGSSAFSLNLVLLPSLYGSRASPFSSLGLSLPIHKMGITEHRSGVCPATHTGSDSGVTLDLSIHILGKGWCSRLMDGCKALCGLVWLACPRLLSQELQEAPVWVKRILTGDLSCSCRVHFALRRKGVGWTLAAGWVVVVVCVRDCREHSLAWVARDEWPELEEDPVHTEREAQTL